MTKGEWSEIEPDELLIEAATENRDKVREWAKELVALRDHAREHKEHFSYDDECDVAEAFLALDRYMIDGGALPYGWAFFTNQPDTRKRKGQRK